MGLIIEIQNQQLLQKVVRGIYWISEQHEIQSIVWNNVNNGTKTLFS